MSSCFLFSLPAAIRMRTKGSRGPLAQIGLFIEWESRCTTTANGQVLVSRLLIIWLLQQAARCCGRQRRVGADAPWYCRSSARFERNTRSERDFVAGGAHKPDKMACVAAQLCSPIFDVSANTTYWALLKQPDN